MPHSISHPSQSNLPGLLDIDVASLTTNDRLLFESPPCADFSRIDRHRPVDRTSEAFASD